MQLGFVGLGKMGMNMVTRLTGGNHAVVAWDRSAEAVTRVRDVGATGADGGACVLCVEGTYKAPLQQNGLTRAGVHGARQHAQ